MSIEFSQSYDVIIQQQRPPWPAKVFASCLRHSYRDRVIPLANESIKQSPFNSLTTTCFSWKSYWEICCNLFDLVYWCYPSTSVVSAVEVENRNRNGWLSNPCDLHILLCSYLLWHHVLTYFQLEYIRLEARDRQEYSCLWATRTQDRRSLLSSLTVCWTKTITCEAYDVNGIIH